MEKLYAPMFATENCLLFGVGAILGVTALGAMASGIFWLAIWKLPNRPRLLATLGVGSSIFCLFGGYLFLTSKPMVSVSTDWDVIEHRWCQRTNLIVDRYRIEDVDRFAYRRDVDTNLNTGRERISHYLDIIVPTRSDPISISLDATSLEIDLEKVRRLAPEAVAQFEVNR